MKVVSIVGNRPQFVKAAPLSRALRARVDEVLVHSGQHYDPELADLFFDELGVPRPDHALEVGSGTPIAQTALMLQRLEPLLVAEAPDMVLVYGDTTTTLAGALAAAKLGLRLGHVEAGLRSFDMTMPEEQNRVVADHLSDLLLCPTDVAVANLAREGITRGVHQVGDVMLDASRMFAPAAAARPGPAALGLDPGGYLLVTVHRAAATDTPEALDALVAVLEAIDEPAVFPVHPRTRHRLQADGRWARLEGHPSLRLQPPGGLPRLHRPAARRARRGDRLRRRPEGGLLPRRAVRDAARHDGVGRDRGGRLQHPHGHGSGPRGRRAVSHRDAGGAPAVLRGRGGGGADRRRRRLRNLTWGVAPVHTAGDSGPSASAATAVRITKICRL